MKWTKENINKIASSFDNLNDFMKTQNLVYQAAWRMGILDEVCFHMTKRKREWSLEEIKSEALKYQTRKQFGIGSCSAYSMARKTGVLDDVCSHMKKVYEVWTTEKILNEALKYEYRSDFKSNRAYHIAQKRGILDEVCKHMKFKSNGYNTELGGYFYLVRWDFNGISSFLKYGITNKPVDFRLYQQCGYTEYKPEKIFIKYFEDGKIPISIERTIKKTINTGIVESSLFGDGWTETIEDNPSNVEFIRKILI